MSNNEEMIDNEIPAAEEQEAEQETIIVETEEETDSETVSVDTETEAKPEEKKEDWRKRLFKDLREILVILAVFMVIYVLFFRVVVVKGNSMNNTLVDGDRLLLLSGLLYNNPEQGDVVVAAKESFKNGEPIIKRVIATEGQVVDINFDTGVVYVDGVELEETYISTPTTDFLGVHFPATVPEGCVFVMGDNRGNSQDSRSPQIGFIDEREILGRAIFLLVPGSDDRHPFDISRIGGVD